MQGKFIDRTGEINYNNFGSKMEIIKYSNSKNTDIYFPKYNWVSKNRDYKDFKNGNIKCPYEPRYFDYGYLGEGEYRNRINNQDTKYYRIWEGMLCRCYWKNFKDKRPTYKNCKVDKEWHNFQNFAKWFHNNYYTVDNETMCLDKDILIKGNKIYSPDTCIFVPQRINILFTKTDKNRGDLPIGVREDKRRNKNKYIAACSIYNLKKKKKKTKYLGSYKTPEEAFETYKQFKEQYIKQIADYYKDKIPQRLYNAMYQYEVEITD